MDNINEESKLFSVNDLVVVLYDDWYLGVVTQVYKKTMQVSFYEQTKPNRLFVKFDILTSNTF